MLSFFSNKLCCTFVLGLGLTACNLAPPDETLFGETDTETNTESCTGEACAPSAEQDDDTPTVITDWAGNLSINLHTSSDLLTNLQTISGDLQIGPDEAITLPALTRINGSLIIQDNDALLSLSAPNLQSIGGDLFLSANNRMTDLQLPALENIGMNLRIVQNKNIETININALTQTALSCSITHNIALAVLQLDALTNVGFSLEITGNTNLPACAAEAIADNLSSGSSSISDNDNSATCDE
jgi:hypothetical protein